MNQHEDNGHQRRKEAELRQAQWRLTKRLLWIVAVLGLMVLFQVGQRFVG